ncbi:MAG: glycosyltransferase [Polyangiaceae bacterium]|nr:glycosyltransferase [Polyangiaceae bacterium]
MKIAYLVNQYPLLSHSFVRREIQGVEADGSMEVARYSVRDSGQTSIDPDDLAETGRTRVLLRRGTSGLFADLGRVGLRHPAKVAQSATLAVQLGLRSDRGLLRHIVYLAEACSLARDLETFGVRHVHAHFGTNSTTVAMLASHIAGGTFSFTAHGPEEFDKPLSIGLAEKIARAAFVVGVSSFGRSQLLRHARTEAWEKVHVVHCGVDASYLAADPTPVPDRRRFVCVGRLCEQKGQLVLVEAAARLRSQGTEFELLLVGDGEMRGPIEALITQRGLAGTVRILGCLAGHEVKAEIERSRAFVLPSFAEGLPVVIMEALAAGRPVISTYVAGIPELVVPGENGWLVPAGSVEALATAMGEALTASTEALTRMGSNGHAKVRELHDARSEGEKLRLLFRQVLESG